MEDITQCLTVTFERLQFTRLENWPLQVAVKVEVEADSCHQLQLTPEDCCWKRSVRNVRDIFIILFIHAVGDGGGGVTSYTLVQSQAMAETAAPILESEKCRRCLLLRSVFITEKKKCPCLSVCVVVCWFV